MRFPDTDRTSEEFPQVADPDRRRVVLLGASNLTLGFPLLVESLRLSLGQTDILAAHGHGRSFGTCSSVLGRTLPGLRDCGLWEDLASRPPPASVPLALITDVGNDLLYGQQPTTILGWIEDCLNRLRRYGATTIVTGMPRASVLRMRAARYHATRLCFFPRRGPSWQVMRCMIEELDGGLRSIADQYGAQFIEPSGSWYGLDPIHVRRSRRPEAWREILSRWPQVSITMHQGTLQRSLQLWGLRPADRRFLGRAYRQRQPVLREPETSISLY